ncbi:TonB-dependent receptor [uncultured Algibacter sp.]|uniref:TonB-dependent receptor domain-containing protein n=1 Tax=uncultured Algibacter sp. TaxID=298659 RepID=UPI003217E6A6
MKYLITLLLLIFPLFIFSQIDIKGQIKDVNAPVVWANIILTTPNGDTVTGGISDDNGVFNLNTKAGNYKLTISFIGYKTFSKDIVLNETLDLGIITLNKDDNALEEVVITHQKKLIEQKPDRIIFNVENSISASTGDALDALKVAPGLQVQNGIINMFGKGIPQVMINDRLLPLTGEELTNYLNSISGNDIKKIEIITAPPAKYEASGNGGLINIVLKKGHENSWKNTSSIMHNIDTYNFTTFRNSLLYNKSKVNLSFSVDKTRGFIRGIEDFQVFYPTSTWDIDINTKDSKKALSSRLLLDYELTKNTTIGVQYLGSKNNPSISDRSTTRIFNTNSTIDSLLINNGQEHDERISHALNVHSVTKLDTLGKILSFDVDYFNYDAQKTRDFRTESFNANNEFQNINFSAIADSDQSIKNLSFRADMVHPLKTMTLSYGFRTSSTVSKSGIAFFNTITGTPEFDNTVSNRFTYDENNQAVYIDGSKKLNNKWQVKLGLRLEITATKGFSVELNQTNNNNYTKLFPTFYASYKKDENNDFSFSYSKRIQRPRFNNLNPFRVYVSSNTFSEGNPFLQPAFNDNFEIKHTYKNKLTTNVFLNRRTNASGVIFASNIEENTQIVTRDNFFNQTTIGFGQNYLFNTLNWLQSNNGFTLIHSTSKFKKPIDARPQNGFSYIASSNNTIKFSTTSKLQIDAFYNSKSQSDLFTFGDIFSLDLGYSKSFLNNNLKCNVVIKDIFATSNLDNLESVVNGVRQVYGQSRNNRYVRFSLSYSFGNNKINSKNRAFGNEEETNRIN